MAQKIFEKLILKKIVLDKPYDTYFVFAKDGSVVEVRASNAYEAISKSAVANPIKAKNIRYLLYESTIITECLISEKSKELLNKAAEDTIQSEQEISSKKESVDMDPNNNLPQEEKEEITSVK